MKIMVLVLAVLMGSMMFIGTAKAETAADIFADTAIGKNDSCPLTFHTELLKEFKDVNLAFLGNPDIQIGIAYNCDSRSLVNGNSVEIINRVIY